MSPLHLTKFSDMNGKLKPSTVTLGDFGFEACSGSVSGAVCASEFVIAVVDRCFCLERTELIPVLTPTYHRTSRRLKTLFM